MQRLPAVVFADVHYELPLPDASAEALIAALVATEPGVRRVVLCDALVDDPALALWTLLASGEHPLNEGVSGVGALAELLAAKLDGGLVWPESAEHAVGAEPATLVATCVELAGRSVASALASGNGAAAVDSASAAPRSTDPRYLLGLLRYAEEWLALSRGGPIAAEHRGPLPSWLASLSDPPAKAGNADAATAVEATRRRWLRTSPLAAHLPALAAKLARLGDLEQRFDRVLEDEKLQAMYKLAAGAGHEINNPLGAIAGRAQLLLRDETDPERRRTLAKINAQAFRAHEMIADMMLFARPPEPVSGQVDLVRLLDDVLDGLRAAAAERHTALLRAPADSPVLVRADADQLKVAVRAMCANALEALGAGGHIELAARRAGAANGAAGSPAQGAEIIVSDDGPGISPEVRRHLFDPFYSGREAGRGLGLGLSKCWRIVKNHGGRIDVEGGPGRGARFTITLPG